MASILTSRQSLELHKAIVQYLKPILHDHPEALQIISTKLDAADDVSVPHYLEKKWSSVLRLQKKILDLENEVNSYKALLDQASTESGPLVLNKLDWLPSAPSVSFPLASAQVPNSVAIHPKLPVLVAASSDGSMTSWALSADALALPQRQWHAHSRAVHRIRWSTAPIELNAKQAYLMASCSSDLSIKIWEGEVLKHVRTLTGHEHTVSSICFSPSVPKRLYSVSRDLAVKIWDLTTGNCVRTFVGHSDWVRDVDVVNSPSLGEFVLTCSNDQSVRLSHESGTGIAMLLGHTHVIEAVRFLPRGFWPYIDKYLKINIDRYPHLLEAIILNAAYTETLGFKYCVSAGRDNLIKLWLLPPPAILPNRPPQPALHNGSQGWHILDILGHQSWVKDLDVHPNERFLFSASDDKSIRIWDFAALESGSVACIRTLLAHTGFVNAVHFARFELELTDQQAREKAMRCLFVSAATDNTVKLWS